MTSMPTVYLSHERLRDELGALVVTIAVHRAHMTGHYYAEAIGVYPAEQAVFRLMQDEKVHLKHGGGGRVGVCYLVPAATSELFLLGCKPVHWCHELDQCNRRDLLRSVHKVLTASLADGRDWDG